NCFAIVELSVEGDRRPALGIPQAFCNAVSVPRCQGEVRRSRDADEPLKQWSARVYHVLNPGSQHKCRGGVWVIRRDGPRNRQIVKRLLYGSGSKRRLVGVA